MADWRDRITVNPAVCHGRACIAGTRVLVAAVLDNLAAGIPERDILHGYPSLTPADIRASLAYGASLARER